MRKQQNVHFCVDREDQDYDLSPDSKSKPSRQAQTAPTTLMCLNTKQIGQPSANKSDGEREVEGPLPVTLTFKWGKSPKTETDLKRLWRRICAISVLHLHFPTAHSCNVQKTKQMKAIETNITKQNISIDRISLEESIFISFQTIQFFFKWHWSKTEVKI